MKYIGVVGSRGYDDYDAFVKRINYYTRNMDTNDITFVSGGAPSGADNMIERFCEEHNMPIIVFHAKWDEIEGKPDYEIGTRRDGTKYWKLAGFDRNIEIVGKSHFIIAFWDGRSTGTKNTIDLAKDTARPLREVIVKI